MNRWLERQRCILWVPWPLAVLSMCGVTMAEFAGWLTGTVEGVAITVEMVIAVTAYVLIMRHGAKTR